MSQPRLTYDASARIAPVARQSLIAMGRQADDSGIDKQIIELVKLRASQFNNCAFCLQIHLNVARKLGGPQEKLDLVATWEELGIFSEQEPRGLTWAETLTRLVGRSVSNEAHQAVRQHFSKEEVAFLSVSIATIDA